MQGWQEKLVSKVGKKKKTHQDSGQAILTYIILVFDFFLEYVGELNIFVSRKKRLMTCYMTRANFSAADSQYKIGKNYSTAY